jgi:hypothetical protein
MQQQRQEFSFLSPDTHTLLVSAHDKSIIWYTFGGSMVNQILARHFTEFCGLPSEGNELSVTFDLWTDPHALIQKIECVHIDDLIARFSFDLTAVEALKFHQTLPPQLQQRVLKARMIDHDALQRVLALRTKVVFAPQNSPWDGKS